MPMGRTHMEDRTSGLPRPCHQSFLDGEAENLEAPQRSRNTFIARGNSRQIGYVNYNGPTYQYYASSQPPEHSPILEWLWPQSADSSRSPAAVQYVKQNVIHKAASEARKGQADPWLLGRNEFNDWFTGTGGSLWIWGKVGCGKTVLFSAMINHVRSAQAIQKGIRLGYYYCRFQNDTEGELSLVLRRWLAQISDKNDVPKCLQELHNSCHDSYPPRDPTSEELEEVLLEVLQAYGALESPRENSHHPEEENKIFLLIDALDEVPIDDGQNVEVLDMLHRIANEKLPNVFILATSRDRADIGEYLRRDFGEIRMDYDAIDEEIGAYVPSVIKSSPRLNRQSAETKDAITKRLVTEAKGMFLWAALQMRLLRSLKVITKYTVEKVLSELPKDLNETYRRIFDSIDQNLAPKALLALKWIVLAKRPLFIEELVETCAFRAAPSPELEPESIRLQAYNFFELLQDLVVIEPHLDLEEVGTHVKKRTHSVTLAHVSLIEYLIEPAGGSTGNHPFQFSPTDGHRLIARSCLSYLFHFNTPDTQKETYVLLEYAWYNWEKHVVTTTVTTEEQGRVRRKALILFDQLIKLADCPGDVSDRETLLRLLDWLPQGHLLEPLMEALNTPHFYPNIHQFLAMQDSGYLYPALSNRRNIRLLYLLPSLAIRSPVLCRLEEVSLDDQPKYDALSYTWGNPEWLERIRLHGAEIPVTENLYNILRTLCAQEQGQTPALWVDALCINQSDVSERSHQVALIGPIFQAAQEVVLCMGAGRDTSEKAVTMIRDLASSISMDDTIHRAPLPEEDQLRVTQLFSSQFWTRMWTIQEVVLARRGTVLVGDLSFPLSIVEEIFRRIYSTSNDASRSPYPPAYRFLLNDDLNYVRNNIFTRIEYKASRLFEIAELLCRFSRHQCVDNRDKIYSVLGLLPDGVPQRLLPDYTKDRFQVFLDAAWVNLLGNGNLNILSHVSTHLNGEMTPSWLPMYENETLPFVSCAKDRWIFKAGGMTRPTLPEIDIDVGNIHLRVLGVTVNRVKIIFDDRDWTLNEVELRMMIEEASGRSCISSFWDVFLASQSDYGCRLFEGSVPGMTVPPTTIEEELALLRSPELPSWPDFRLGRRFFLTESGAIGLGPEDLQQGDVVVVLAGGPVPYLLRKELWEQGTESCGFVGECYLNGFMDGEAVHDDTNWEYFCIR